MSITCIKDRYKQEHHIIMAFTDGHEFLSNFESCKVTLKGKM